MKHLRDTPAPKRPSGWIGFDFDRTLAYYGHGAHTDVPQAEPLPIMVELVNFFTSMGIEVRIMTARISPFTITTFGEDADTIRGHLETWSEKHLGFVARVTCEKDHDMIALIDDRAVSAHANTGQLLIDHHRLSTITGIDCSSLNSKHFTGD